MKPPRRACELCKDKAALHCESDSAFLCFPCDATVHSANFLVARHLRRLLCPHCQSPHLSLPSGPGFLHHLPTIPSSPCLSCLHSLHADLADDSSSDSSSLSSSCSSSCVSSAESAPATDPKSCRIESVPADTHHPIDIGWHMGLEVEWRRKRSVALDATLEGVLLSWCRKLGLDGVVASHALNVALRKSTALPFRVCVAAAVWFAAKICGGGSEKVEEEEHGGERRRRRLVRLLRRLEACSGVPAKHILLAESRLSRVVTRRHVDETEGWAECP